MDAETQKKILVGCLDECEAEVAASELSKAERIIEARVALARRRQAALEAFKAEARNVDSLLAELQQQCQHPATTDSYGMPGEARTTCDLCEKEL